MSRKCREIRPGLVISCVLAELLWDILLFTRSGRAAYLRTCAMLDCESRVVIFRIDNPPADVVEMASRANKSSVDRFLGLVGRDSTRCFNTASLHYNHVMICVH